MDCLKKKGTLLQHQWNDPGLYIKALLSLLSLPVSMGFVQEKNNTVCTRDK